ncbi:hypothetical protein ACOMHN_024634 [Nucella lapillus]
MSVARSLDTPPQPPFPSPSALNITAAQIAAAALHPFTTNSTNITNNNSSSNSSEGCWNEYCWDEAEYQAELEEHIFPQDFEWFFIALYSLTFFVGLVGNVLVCFAVWRNHNMRTVTNVFIVNLAVGDFLVILLCLPPTLVQNVALTWFFGAAVCKALLFLQNVALTWFFGAAVCAVLLFLQVNFVAVVSVSVLTLSAIAVERWYAICYDDDDDDGDDDNVDDISFQNTSVSVSVLTLSAIAVERWYAICYPLSFRSTLSRARNMIIIIWIAAMIIALPELIVADTHPYPFPPPFQSALLTVCRPSWEPWKQSIYQLILALAMYLAPMVLMILTYTHIALVLWMQEIPGDSFHGTRPMLNGGRSNGAIVRGSRLPEDQLASRRKAAKMLIAIVVVFAICYLPVHLMNVLRYFQVLQLDGNAAVVQALISHWLPYFNSALNPVIYNFMSAKFRKEFKVACFCCFYCGFRHRPFRRREQHTFTMTFSHSNYSNCHTEEVTLASLKD